GYPGGPAISAKAVKFEIRNSKFEMKLPRPLINSKNYDFSYAGLKTAVLYKVRDLKNAGIKLTDKLVNEICYEFQNAALDVLISKTVKAAQEYKARSIFLSGGVSANKELRERLRAKSKELGTHYSCPPLEYTTDNAAMIAVAGYFSSRNKNLQDLTWDKVEMDANLGF
ncbi:MAG: tRNA (adenosine(37)-N6)-threonylcarbamoyltransferase complex transferase subunit TsaD, partial [Patescibacteria group bacterium]